MDARNCLLYCVQYQDAFPVDYRTAQHFIEWIGDSALTQCDTPADFLAVAKCFDAANEQITPFQWPEGMRLYHLVAINERTGAETVLTGYPMKHEQCCTMKSKFTDHPGRRIQLKEFK